VAETFGDLDPRIDAREGDVAKKDWGGFHLTEQALYVNNTATGWRLAKQLQADVEQRGLIADTQQAGHDAERRGRAAQQCQSNHRRGRALLAHRPRRLLQRRGAQAASAGSRSSAKNAALATQSTATSPTCTPR
jgi:hypothetical protein